MAIFIMGIGMVSVFAIFPVAALMMGQAIEKYQINEVVNNTQSNFDADALEFIKNKPDWIYSGGSVLNPALNGASPQYLFLDQAAGPSRSSLGGVTVAYINGGGVISPNQINDRYFTSNFDIELDESGRAVTPVSSVGRYSVSFLLEKKPPLDNPLPSRRYMLVYKGRSQTFADFLGVTKSLPYIFTINGNQSFSGIDNTNLMSPSVYPAFNSFTEIVKKNDWLMIYNSLGERTFHQIRNINNASNIGELELFQKFNTSILNGSATIQSVYLLSDVVRVIDMGAG